VIETLKAAGIRRDEVTLVELSSNIGGDVYTNALASGAVDAAPIRAEVVAQHYVRDFGPRGAHLLKHPPFRDDGGSIFVPETALADAGKAAALRVFARYWGLGLAWINAHPEELAQGYFAGKRGLSIADARVMAAYYSGMAVPRDWAGAIAYEQAAIDTLGPQTKHPRFDAAKLFDRRFETIAGDAASSAQGKQS
jgi:sulfonate transport system substrate-binding protein